MRDASGGFSMKMKPPNISGLFTKKGGDSSAVATLINDEYLILMKGNHLLLCSQCAVCLTWAIWIKFNVICPSCNGDIISTH